jgi:NAD(P)-dependent dehydrogenase (short-subunit alcohol dehydrogenase family)
MSDSFLIQPDKRRHPEPAGRKVLITGAAGRIGSYFAEHHHEQYELTLVDHPDVDTGGIDSFGRVESCELGDAERLRALCADQDTLLHLAADPNPAADWDSMLPNNIIGTYNAFTAAQQAGCRRVVYASSIHAVSGYPTRRQVQADDPVSPGDLYGVTKCFGEALGRFLATQRGLSVIAVRIGGFQSTQAVRDNDQLHLMDGFVSRRDLDQLLQCCIDDESLLFAIFHGLSHNRFNRMNTIEAEELLGYDPQDDFTELNRHLHELNLAESVRPHNESHR